MIKAGEIMSVEIGGTREPPYRVDACVEGHIHTLIVVPDHPRIDLTFKTPEDGYDFAQAILHAYDIAVGIA